MKIRCFFLFFFILSLVVFSNCKKSDDDEDTPATPPGTGTGTGGTTTEDSASAVDLSDDSFDETLREIMPVGSLSLSLTRTGEPNGTPCNDTDNADDETQPTGATMECAIAKIFADPDVYGNVGSEGVLENMMTVDRVFKKSATATCADPLTGDAQDITGPFLPGARKYSCGYLIPGDELVTNFKAAELPNMADFLSAEC